MPALRLSAFPGRLHEGGVARADRPSEAVPPLRATNHDLGADSWLTGWINTSIPAGKQ